MQHLKNILKPNKMRVFPIIIEPLEEGGFLANCPLLQGCRAEGNTYGEAIENIQDVIREKITLKYLSKRGELPRFIFFLYAELYPPLQTI